MVSRPMPHARAGFPFNRPRFTSTSLKLISYVDSSFNYSNPNAEYHFQHSFLPSSVRWLLYFPQQKLLLSQVRAASSRGWAILVFSRSSLLACTPCFTIREYHTCPNIQHKVLHRSITTSVTILQIWNSGKKK